eukprot:5314160-Karenia_brevis.AAC.1
MSSVAVASICGIVIEPKCALPLALGFFLSCPEELLMFPQHRKPTEELQQAGTDTVSELCKKIKD